MGGCNGEVTGKTKIQTYLNYVEECESWPLDHDPDPRHKKHCTKLMQWDGESKEWVLEFRFSK